MALITYDDKVAINENSQVADINKVTASDMNEIKNIVNQNANDLDDVINNKITEIGSNNNGTWRKYANGDMECWFSQSMNVSINTQWGSLYAAVVNLHDFPQEFIEIPNVQISLAPYNWQALIGRTSDSSLTVSNPGNIALFRGNSAGSATYTVHVYAKGKWK